MIGGFKQLINEPYRRHVYTGKDLRWRRVIAYTPLYLIPAITGMAVVDNARKPYAWNGGELLHPIADPAAWERVMAASPTLLIGATFWYVLFVATRIAMRMAAQEGNPFSEEGRKDLGRALVAVLVGIIVLMSLHFLVAPAAGLLSGDKRLVTGEQGGMSFDPMMTVVFLGAMSLLGAFRQIYSLGRAAYEELEKGV